jgi:hypothetical protein
VPVSVLWLVPPALQIHIKLSCIAPAATCYLPCLTHTQTFGHTHTQMECLVKFCAAGDDSSPTKETLQVMHLSATTCVTTWFHDQPC